MADGNAPKRIFLRKILYRIDFQLITEKMQEELFQYAAEKYSQYFSNQGSEQENSVDIEINPLSSRIPKMNTRLQNVFVLIHPKNDDSDGRTIKIGKTFIYLELDLNIVSMNLPYYEWFSDIVDHIKTNPMFRPTRVGLRKFNLFYILDEDKQSLEEIFRMPFFTNADVDAFELSQTNTAQVYNTENYTLNFSREYSTGNLSNASIDNKLAHLIAFDFDLYSTEQSTLDEFIQNPKNGLIKMNDKIYQFFTHVVNDNIVYLINGGDLLERYKVLPF